MRFKPSFSIDATGLLCPLHWNVFLLIFPICFPFMGFKLNMVQSPSGLNPISPQTLSTTFQFGSWRNSCGNKMPLRRNCTLSRPNRCAEAPKGDGISCNSYQNSWKWSRFVYYNVSISEFPREALGGLPSIRTVSGHMQIHGSGAAQARFGASWAFENASKSLKNDKMSVRRCLSL